MSLSAMLFGSGSKIHKITNILGLGIPSLLNKAFAGKDPKLAAVTLGELTQQTAKEGEPRPIPFGICRPIGTNVMYQSQPIRRMVKTYAGKAGGKGGKKKKKQYQDVEHVYRYYALRVCEGPITGYRRIWRNGTLVYDARKGSAWGAKNNHLFFQSYRLYTGAWNQMPDPAMQSMLKDTNIPAFRGTAYLMAVNEDLTDFGGAIPQWQFEVAKSEGYYATSRPYAIEQLDGVASVFDVGVDLVAPPSGTSVAGLTGFTFKASLIETVSYSQFKQPLSEAAGLSSVTFKASLIETISYSQFKQPLSEAAGLTGITFKATLKTQVIDVVVPPDAAEGVFNVKVELT